jgi:AmmeMemoRadiSam system protein A
MELSASDKKELLKLARMSIGYALGECSRPKKPEGGKALSEQCGAFVTLHLHGDLRGCIGYIEGRFPLTETIEEVAKKAAFEDPRFSPLTAEEFQAVEIEISVLSPLRKVTDIGEIQVGSHGLVIDAGYSRGLLLPQVATEYGWGREEFLSHTARKAGLAADAWKRKDVTLYLFTSDVFSEHQRISSGRQG